jgi:preprotein translocase subunit Sec61beta
MMNLYNWLLFLHILFAFIFSFAHGTSLAVAFRLPAEKDAKARAALLAITGSVIAPMYGGFIGMSVCGVALGVIAAWWKQGWWWLSIVLMLGVFIWMIWYSRKYYSPIRKALGLHYVTRFTVEHQAGGVSASEEEVSRLIALTQPRMITWVSFIVTALVLYLMTFKPF